MKRITAIYPPLFAAFPILSIFAANQALIPLRDLWRPLGFAVLGALFLWGVLSLILRSAERGAVATSVLALGFLGLDWVASLLPMAKEVSATWFVSGFFVIVAAALMAWKWKWHRPLSFFSIVLVALPIFQIVSTQMSNATKKPLQIKSGGRTTELPDIVYVILDGYGRTDVFEREYGFSDQSFIEDLEARGFYVAKQAHSNYSQTELSISSSLNVDYIQNLKGILPVREGMRPNFSSLLEGNAVMARLKSAGYVTSAITTGFPSLQFQQVDRKEVAQVGVNLLESNLIQRIPLLKTSRIVSTMFEERREMLRKAFDQLATLSDQGVKPQFTMVHILAPHPPFSFGPNGEAMPKKGPYGYWDGSDYVEMVSTKDDYKKGYAGQAVYVGKRLIAAIDQILARPGPRPILILQGDHGPKMGLDQSHFEKTDIQECFPILNALLVPDEVKTELYPDITPVNTFRTVFRVLLGDELSNLADRSWYSPYGRPLEFTEVTNSFDKRD